MLLEAQNTGFEPKVKRELAKAEVRMKEATQKELLDVEKKAVELSGRREIAAGLDLVARERTRHSAPEWTTVLDRLARDLRESAARLFGELKAKAVAARGRGAGAEVQQAKAEVATWGLPEYLGELDAALQIDWPPIFAGRTTDSLSAGCHPWWMAVDGALVPLPSKEKQAAQSKLDFGDGEFRFRFTQRNCSLVTISVRQGSTLCRLALDRNDLSLSGLSEHEVLFTCRGGTGFGHDRRPSGAPQQSQDAASERADPVRRLGRRMPDAGHRDPRSPLSSGGTPRPGKFRLE